MPLSAAIHAHRVAPWHLARRVGRKAGFRWRVPTHHHLHRHGFHHQAPAWHEEGKALKVGRLESRLDCGTVAMRHPQRRIAALVAHMHALMHTPARLGRHRTEALTLDVRQGGVRQFIEHSRYGLKGLVIKHPLHRLLSDHRLVGQPHSVGREHAGQGMHEYPAHAQRIGHPAGMLPACTAEALQGVASHVVAARHRDLLDGVGHLLHRDVDEALCHGFSRAARAGSPFSEALMHHLGVQRLVAARPKDLGEPGGLDLADQHIGIGHRQRATTPVAGRARVGPCALWPYTEACTVEFQDRPTACGHGVDAHHRRAHANTRHLCFELALELAGVVAHVGGCTPHVEADHAPVPGQRGGSRHAHDAPSRAREDRVLPLEHGRVGQAARGLHEEQAHARHLGGHLFHIAAQDGAEVGVDHRGVATADELHQRAGFMGCADLREAHLAGDARCGCFVRREPPPVQEHHGHAAQPRIEGRPQAFAQVRFIKWLQQFAVSADPFLRLDHPGIEQFRQHDVSVEQAGPVLISDPQRVAEAVGGHQKGGLALAFQQRVGGHRGTHLHAGHQTWRDRLFRPQPQQVPDAGDGGVRVLLGVFAEELVREQVAIWPPGDDVGEGAAAVDPELPGHAGSLGVPRFSIDVPR